MAGSYSPTPTFILCPDFNIPPPPLGQLQLGSVLCDLGVQGVLNPINRGDEIQVSDSSLVPPDGPLEKAGFTRRLADLHHVKSNIWARILKEDILAMKFFGKRIGNETLTVDKLFMRYFTPNNEFLKQTLESPTVSSFVDGLKHKKRIYLITGLIWTEGAKLSKMQHHEGNASSEFAVSEPLSSTSNGSGGSYAHGSTISCGFDASSPFILGFRVKKIWWDRHGEWHQKERTAGCTLSKTHGNGNVMENMRHADDEVDNERDQTFVDETSFGEDVTITWVLQ
ncbi:hypothetical protein HDV63DRAFT_176865 [Trichoderma sp. SZMC 28014]